MKTNIHLRSHLAQFVLVSEMFYTKVAEKIKTHILCSKLFFFFFANRAVYESKWKIAVQVIDNMGACEVHD